MAVVSTYCVNFHVVGLPSTAASTMICQVKANKSKLRMSRRVRVAAVLVHSWCGIAVYWETMNEEAELVVGEESGRLKHGRAVRVSVGFRCRGEKGEGWPR